MFECIKKFDLEVTNYFARTMEISNKMQFHGEKMTDATIVEKILHSLTTNFNYVVCSIEESKDIDVLSIDELQSSLLVHEQKMNKSSTTEERALKASTATIFIPPISEEGEGGEVEVGVEEEENVETEKITRIPELILQAKAEDNTLTDPS